MSITPEQVSAARRLLGWSQDSLGGMVGLSRSSVRKFELGEFVVGDDLLNDIRAALEAAGTIFVEENGKVGVRLRKAEK